MKKAGNALLDTILRASESLEVTAYVSVRVAKRIENRVHEERACIENRVPHVSSNSAAYEERAKYSSRYNAPYGRITQNDRNPSTYHQTDNTAARATFRAVGRICPTPIHPQNLPYAVNPETINEIGP